MPKRTVPSYTYPIEDILSQSIICNKHTGGVIRVSNKIVIWYFYLKVQKSNRKYSQIIKLLPKGNKGVDQN